MTLMLTRHHGLDQVIPQSSQWETLIDVDDECWLCESHTIALFIWTPRIGLFSMIKDEDEINYYREQLSYCNEPK